MEIRIQWGGWAMDSRSSRACHSTMYGGQVWNDMKKVSALAHIATGDIWFSE